MSMLELSKEAPFHCFIHSVDKERIAFCLFGKSMIRIVFFYSTKKCCRTVTRNNYKKVQTNNPIWIVLRICQTTLVWKLSPRGRGFGAARWPTDYKKIEPFLQDKNSTTKYQRLFQKSNKPGMFRFFRVRFYAVLLSNVKLNQSS